MDARLTVRSEWICVRIHEMTVQHKTEAVCTSTQADKTISLVIELHFSPEDMARIDRAAQFEGLDRTALLQRAAIFGLRDALRESELVQSFDEGGNG